MKPSLETNENIIEEKELTIKIPLENFSYNGLQNSGADKTNTPVFFGRKKERDRLLDHLQNVRSGSFLVSGYRGVGKTRFVREVLKHYKKNEEINEEIYEVKINLGSDGDLSSKSVLFNMISLLGDQLEKNRLFRFLLFFRNNQVMIFSTIVLSSLLISTIKSYFFGISEWYFHLFIFFCFVVLLYVPIALLFEGKTHFFKRWSALIKLRNLEEEIYAATEIKNQVRGKYFNSEKKVAYVPLTTNQIEVRLKKILEELGETKTRIKIFFIFDELDKLTGRIPSAKETAVNFTKESNTRKQQVDSILGDLKNIITDSEAYYIFIAGREIYDAYLSERGSSNSLYESLFNDHIYIPSLLTDRSDGERYLLDGMIEAFVVSNLIPKESYSLGDGEINLSCLKLYNYQRYVEERGQTPDINNIYILKTLVHLLTLHSWGNCKRLFTLFESFVVKEKEGTSDTYKLHFSTQDIQRLVLSSQLYILFHHNLSRMLMNADDKLMVSSFSIFHHILKYHGMGFSREHILRMYETINIHSSPELVRIVDTIIHNVLLNHVRQIKNGLYQYRFTLLHEKEIHFITTINEGESAVFNFSLNAMDAVKQHYNNLIVESKNLHAVEHYGHISWVPIHIILGNFHFWEQSFDEAINHYSNAINILEKNKSTNTMPDTVDLTVQSVKLFLKRGIVYEKVGNYTAAAASYLNAEKIAIKCFKTLESARNEFFANKPNDSRWHINLHDPKWDILRQPRWAKLFLNLKNGAQHYKNQESKYLSYKLSSLKESEYKNAVLLFFLERFEDAKSMFINVAEKIEPEDGSEFEYESFCFIKGNAYLKAGFSLFLKFSDELHKELKNSALNTHDKEAPLKQFKSKLEEVIGFSVEEIRNHTLFESPDAENDITKYSIVLEIINLLNKSANSFEKGRLNFNAAISYLCIVLIWQAFLELIPWKKDKGDQSWEGMEDLGNIVAEAAEPDFILTAQKKAFELFSFNTGEAYHHFMRSVLERNIGKESLELDSYFTIEEQQKRILNNKELLHQHFSLFGQVVAASIYWQKMSVNFIKGEIFKNQSLPIFDENSNRLLPYGIRHYSIMLWLKGRKYLGELLIPERNKADYLNNAAKAIINLVRSTQYIIKTHGETSHMILPPLFMIYYNIWEVLFACMQRALENEKTQPKPEKKSFEQMVYHLRFQLTELLGKADIKDISSRMLDLESAERVALEQFSIIERMSDLSSTHRVNALRNKFYLDDDYEDNMFILDWSYCRFFAPGVMMHRITLEKRMLWLREEFTKLSVN